MKIQKIGNNETVLTFKSGVSILFSYETPVAAWAGSNIGYVKTSKKWSVTTSKHINKWLSSTSSEVKEVEQEYLDNLVNME